LPVGVQPTGWGTNKTFEIFGKVWEYKGLEESFGGYCDVFARVGEEVGHVIEIR
jgi:hypothetical protein